MSRITNNMVINNFLSNFNKNQKRLNKYMEQLTTGERFSRISDDPIDAVKSMKLETTIKFNEQYKENADGGICWIKVTDEALNDINKTLKKLRDGAVRAANGGTLSPEDRQKIEQEAIQMKKHLVEIGNSKYGNSYIFNGFKTKVKPYEDIDSTVPTDYQPNGAISTGKLEREIGAGTTIGINVTGAEMNFSQMFADIQSYTEALHNDDSAGIQTALDNIDTHIENILTSRSQVGSLQNRLELTTNRMSAQKIEYTDILRKKSGTDVAETIMKYKNEEYVSRIALAVGANIIQPTLMDFLR